MSNAQDLPPLLIAVPSGLVTSGVVTWAVRLVNSLVERGGQAGLIVHDPVPTFATLPIRVDSRVSVFAVSTATRLEDCAGDLSAYLPTYRDAVSRMHEGANGRQPVVFSPNLLGDCYGLAAALCLTCPELIRVVGWQHLDIPYDALVLERYEPIVHAFVPVSRRLLGALRERLPARAGDVRQICYGVEVAATMPRREPTPLLRIVYHGRMDDDTKRVGVFPHLARELAARGVEHSITLVGDGPAAADLERVARAIPTLRCLPATSGPALSALLASHDVFVLPSRVEGLSVAMLEAMAHGCVPVVARVESGASEAIDHGRQGLLVEAPDGADYACIPRQNDDALRTLTPERRGELGVAARARVMERYSLASHADSVVELLRHVAELPPRSWPASRPVAFTASAGASTLSASVPPDAGRRMGEMLDSLRGRVVAIHGTGRHTLELAHVFAAHGSAIACFCDDDPARHGQKLWNWPVVAPSDVRRLGVTDVVLSSWLNVEAMWSRRGAYESLGVQGHRLYEAREQVAAR